MATQIVEGETYQVEWDLEAATVNFRGSLRLSSPQEYEPIATVLNRLLEQEPLILTLNLKKLDFLNSSGISMLSKFAINVRKAKTVQMTVIGSTEIPWQGKSLKNLQKLLPSLKLELS